MGTEQITARPWEPNDQERITKFCAGVPGKTADKWISQPNIGPCWRGDYRDWHIEDGRHYQEQLYCRFWEEFINPSGFTCDGCKAHQILSWQSSHLREAFAGLVTVQGKAAAGEILIHAVASAQITEKTALELVDEFDLESA